MIEVCKDTKTFKVMVRCAKNSFKQTTVNEDICSSNQAQRDVIPLNVNAINKRKGFKKQRTWN